MAFRNTHKVGDYLMMDDESGLVHYRSQMVKIWDGTWRHWSNFETRQPQEFVQARNDPRPLRHLRPEPDVTKGCNFVLPTIGGSNTTIPTPTGPFSGKLSLDPGVGDMAVGCNFIVR